MQIRHNTHTGPTTYRRRWPLRGRKSGRTRAQSLVEFAIGAPLLLMLIFGIIDIARLVQARVTVSNAARAAVRVAVTGHQDKNPDGTWIPRATSIYSKALGSLIGLQLNNSGDPNEGGFYSIEINPTDGGEAKQLVRITVKYNVLMMTPLVNAIIPHVMVQGYEEAINEEWGPVQTFDHANIPPTPPPLPTWTPYLTRTPTQTPTPRPTFTPTSTAPPTLTPTITLTPGLTSTPTIGLTSTPAGSTTATPVGALTATSTMTPVRTATSAVTFTSTRTGTRTPTPGRTSTFTGTPTRTRTPVGGRTNTPTSTATPVRALQIGQLVAKKPDGNNQRIDIQISLFDNLGAPVTGATVNGTATGGTKTWGGRLTDLGGGIYRICNVGSFNGSGGGNVNISVTATKNGYTPANRTGTETTGDIAGCP